MRYCDNRRLLELAPDRLLNQVIRLQIDSRCCLVQNQDLGFAQKGAGEADKLALTNAAKIVLTNN